MKSSDIARLEATSHLVNQQPESPEKTAESFKSMLEGINSLTVRNPSASMEPPSSLSNSLPAPTQPSETLNKEKAVDAYRHDRFLPLTDKRKIPQQGFDGQSQSSPPRNNPYRLADKSEVAKATGPGYAKADSSVTAPEAFGKFKNWLHKLFFGDRPKAESNEGLEERSRGIFGSIAHFFKNFGAAMASANSASSTDDELQECSGTSYAKVYGKIGVKENNDAVFAGKNGQNLPVSSDTSADRSQSAAGKQRVEGKIQGQPQIVACSIVNGKVRMYNGKQYAGNSSANSIPTRYPGSTDRIYRAIKDAAARHQLPAELVAAIIKVESDFHPRAVSPKGARGLMQLMPATARELQVRNSFDIEQNIDGGCRYLRSLLDEFDGELRMALAAYNAGPGAVKKHQGIPPYKETRRYLNKVLSHLYARSW